MSEPMKINVGQPCSWHKKDNLGYIAFFEDAERRAKKGQKQKQCPDCLHWYWKDLFGKKSTNKQLT